MSQSEPLQYIEFESAPIYQAWLRLTVSTLATASLGNVENLREEMLAALRENPVSENWDMEERQRIAIGNAQEALGTLAITFLTAHAGSIGAEDIEEAIKRMMEDG